MNYRRGLFRIWLLLSLAWIGFAIWSSIAQWEEAQTRWGVPIGTVPWSSVDTWVLLAGAFFPPVILWGAMRLGIWMVKGSVRRPEYPRRTQQQQ
jgi:hypothetical protein